MLKREAEQIIRDRERCSKFNCCPAFCSNYDRKRKAEYSGHPVSCDELYEQAKEVVAHETD